MAQPAPVKLFFCYAPEDEPLRKELEKHLTLLERQDYLAGWSGRAVGAGDDWRAEIERRMSEAQVILLLVSSDFIASDHLYEVELRHALKRREQGATVYGVLLRPTDWDHGELHSLDMLPRAPSPSPILVTPALFAPSAHRQGVTPVTEWPSHDAAFKSVAEVLREKLGAWGYASMNRITVNPSVAHPRPAPRG
jgi:TIR domain